METITMRLTGTAPLMFSSARSIDPFDEYTRKLAAATVTRKKTLDQHALVSELEWMTRLHTDNFADPAKGRFVVTGDQAFALVVEGGKRSRHGERAKRAIIGATADYFHLKFPGCEKTAGQLLRDPRFVDRRHVKLGTGKSARAIMRTRPVIPNPWSVELSFVVDVREMNASDVVTAMQEAGQYLGLGDYRPRFGRFEATRIKGKVAA